MKEGPRCLVFHDQFDCAFSLTETEPGSRSTSIPSLPLPFDPYTVRQCASHSGGSATIPSSLAEIIVHIIAQKLFMKTFAISRDLTRASVDASDWSEPGDHHYRVDESVTC